MKRASSNGTRALGFASARARDRAGPLARARTVVVACTLGLAAASGGAHAQTLANAQIKAEAGVPSTSPSAGSSRGQLPNAVLFSTGGSRASIGPLDSVIQAALERLGVVTITARPGMDLNAVQLAIDCVSETPECLRAVANQTHAQILIAPSLQNTQSELVLSLLRFDAADGRMRRVLRRQPGTSLKPETLDSVPSMLRELFNVPEPTPHPAPVASEARAADSKAAWLPPIIEPPQEPASSAPLPLGPFLLVGGGALVVGGGAVVGALMLSTQDKYNTLRVSTERDVTKANDLKDTAKTQEVLANVLYGVGGAMLVAGGIWLAVALSQPARRDDDWRTAVVPAIAPGQLGFAIVHRGGAL